MVKVRVTYIGFLADLVGLHTEVIEVPSDNTTVEELIKFLSSTKPSFKEFAGSVPLIQVFVNDEEASLSKILKDNDKVTLMPPLYEGG
ncbi:MAG: MoaD/ThiS family protein [Desulfurococcaceae archaeon TW002]